MEMYILKNNFPNIFLKTSICSVCWVLAIHVHADIFQESQHAGEAGFPSSAAVSAASFPPACVPVGSLLVQTRAPQQGGGDTHLQLPGSPSRAWFVGGSNLPVLW